MTGPVLIYSDGAVVFPCTIVGLGRTPGCGVQLG